METYVGLEWLLDQGVDVINMSLGIGGDGSSMNLYTSFSKWMDHVSFHHCITFVIAAGNYGSVGLYQASMAYNVITVGAVDFNGTATYSDDFLSSVSSYYIGNTYASKPDICAPYGDTSSATSQVTGIIALLFEERSSLIIYPEAVKAIITASVNRSSPHRYVPTYRSTTGNNYMKFGAGLIDAYLSATNITANRYYAGTMLTTDTYDTYTFYVSQANAEVRVSLAFFQPVEATGDHEDNGDLSNYAIADLDLRVYAPGESSPYASSLTFFSSVEIVQFTAPSAGTYTIRVTQYTPLTHVVFYGVAWDIN